MAARSTYTPEIGAALCDLLAQGVALSAAAAILGVAESTARLWERSIPEHGAATMQARELGCHALADRIVEIADDQTREPNCRRVSIDARKWLMSKWMSRVYGERTTIAGDPDAPVSVLMMSDADLARIASGAAQRGDCE